MDADRIDYLDALAGVSEPWNNLRDDDADTIGAGVSGKPTKGNEDALVGPPAPYTAGRVLLDGFDKVLDALEDARHDAPDERETEFRARWEVLNQ